MPSPGKAKAQDISMKYRLFAPRGVKSNTAQQGCRLQPPSPNHCWKTFIAEKVFLPLFLFLGSPGAPAKARGQSLLQRAHDPPHDQKPGSWGGVQGKRQQRAVGLNRCQFYCRHGGQGEL